MRSCSMASARFPKRNVGRDTRRNNGWSCRERLDDQIKPCWRGVVWETRRDMGKGLRWGSRLMRAGMSNPGWNG